MKIAMRLGVEEDIKELEQLYNDINDHLSSTVNYPGWRKGIYPNRETAKDGIREGCLYVAVYDGTIVGTMILRHEPEPAYLPVKWLKELDYEEVFVIYTFVVHPNFLGQGVAQTMLDFAAELGRHSNVKSLRLDVYEGNLPAISLYEKCSFVYIDKVDLGLIEYNLDWFKLYEKLL